MLRINPSQFLTQSSAKNVDVDLLNLHGFTLESLIELAGISVATAIHAKYQTKRNILIIAGSGNNGSDGLVACRHLYHFFPHNESKFRVVYPKQNPKQFGFITQLKSLGISIDSTIPDLETFTPDLIVDAVFGFSFDPVNGVRPPFDTVLKYLESSKTPIVSVDIPSGWDVEKGPITQDAIQPEMLISLSYPKLCAKFFKGKYHFLGGRFLPSSLCEKYGIPNPVYEGVSQCIEIVNK